jgi:catechol 2,3-dioxygenase-like lactoylglutathione lyase family enzyme
MTGDLPHVHRIVCFSLTTADAERAARFYEAAFGCRRAGMNRLAGPEFERLMGVDGGAKRITLKLGRESVELLQFDVPGNPYPRNPSSSDLFFQHFAIAVPDMERAFERLSGVPGWKPISVGGPQRLPASSGGVTAFKFRDPEGHPLELIAFPEGGNPRWPKAPASETCLGIDHSAITVSNTGSSIAFYQGLGLALSTRSFNHGTAQERLDDVVGAEVDVTALAPPGGTPHLELLYYRNMPGRSEAPITVQRSNDIACTRIVFELAPGEAAHHGGLLLRDPDGHALLLAAHAPPYWVPRGDPERSSGRKRTSSLMKLPPSMRGGGYGIGRRRPVAASSRARQAESS